MDTWFKYKNKKFKEDLSKLNISQYICYGNYLASQIFWKAANNKKSQNLFNKFFECAAKILQATIIQKGYNEQEFYDILSYIDQIYKDLYSNPTSLEEYGLMLGNLSELESNYTFTEIIGFIRIMASKI